MGIISVNETNIQTEHICCALSDKKDENSVGSKKDWMKNQFHHGLTFKKLDVRGKVFIEYIPAEFAFAPIDAKDYMFINCFWVSGKYKGQGYGSELLEACMTDAKEKGKKGLVVVSSVKKKPFLSDPKFLKYKGFKVADTAEPYFELLYLPFDDEAVIPSFKKQVKTDYAISSELTTIYYSNQCPHTDKYVGLIKDLAEEEGIPLQIVYLEDYKAAQQAPCPFTTYALYKEGVFVSNEILTEKKFLALHGY